LNSAAGKIGFKKGEQFAAVEDSNKLCSKVVTARMICTICSLLHRNGDPVEAA
jgi:hypothetical protein